jgi:MFS family permease
MTLFAPYIQHFMTVIRGLSPAEYGRAQSVYYVCCVLFEIPTGVFADRFGRRASLLLGSLAVAASCLFFIVARDFGTFVMAEILIALSTAFVNGADSALLFDSFAAERREAEYPRAESLTSAVWLAATAIALPLSDLFLVRRGDPVLAYWATGICGLLSAVAAGAMIEPAVRRSFTAREITAGAVRDVLGTKSIRRLVLYSVGVFLLLRVSMVSFFNPLLSRAGIPPEHWGKILAAINLAGAAASLHARHHLRGYFLAAPPLLLLMFAGLLLWRSPWAASLFLLQGVFFATNPIVIRSFIQPLVPETERRATVLSVESMACRLSVAALAAFAGWMIEERGLTEAVLLSGCLAAVPLIALGVTGSRRRG